MVGITTVWWSVCCYCCQSVHARLVLLCSHSVTLMCHDACRPDKNIVLIFRLSLLTLNKCFKWVKIGEMYHIRRQNNTIVHYQNVDPYTLWNIWTYGVELYRHFIFSSNIGIFLCCIRIFLCLILSGITKKTCVVIENVIQFLGAILNFIESVLLCSDIHVSLQITLGKKVLNWFGCNPSPFHEMISF